MRIISIELGEIHTKCCRAITTKKSQFILTQSLKAFDVVLKINGIVLNNAQFLHINSGMNIISRISHLIFR